MFNTWLMQLSINEWGKRFSVVMLFLMSFWLLVLCVETVSQWHADDLLIQQKTVAPVSSTTLLSTIEQIPERHLFGKLGATEGYLPITSLQLRLVGVILASPEQFSKVIISEQGGPGKMYQLGDSLPCGATVETITDDGVVLGNGGHLEKLPLHRARLQFQGQPTSLFGRV